MRERKIRIKERQEREQAKEVDAKRRRTQVGSDDNLNKSNRVRPRVQIPSSPSTLFSICIEIVTRKERKVNKKEAVIGPLKKIKVTRIKGNVQEKGKINRKEFKEHKESKIKRTKICKNKKMKIYLV